MPRYLRFTLLFAGFLPYAVKLPYMFRAWTVSPQDRYDWIFILLFAMLFPSVWMLTRKRRQVTGMDCHALILLIPAFLGYGAALYESINAVQILCGIAIAFSVFWLIYGGQNTYRMFPTFAMLALGVTSTTYWINYFIASAHILSGLVIKLILAAILLLWLISNYLWEKKVKSGTILFAGAVCVVLLLTWQNSKATTQSGAAVMLKLSEGKHGTYLGRCQELTAEDIRFFGTDNRLEKYYYIADVNGIFVLAITCDRNVNSIHPASHCLRSSGWTVLSEEIIQTEIDHKSFYVDEIVTEKSDTPFLLWVWYSNSRFSTGSFMYFRRMWNRHEVWHTYQVMIPMQENNPENIKKARQGLKAFLETFIVEH